MRIHYIIVIISFPHDILFSFGTIQTIYCPNKPAVMIVTLHLRSALCVFHMQAYNLHDNVKRIKHKMLSYYLLPMFVKICVCRQCCSGGDDITNRFYMPRKLFFSSLAVGPTRLGFLCLPMMLCLSIVHIPIAHAVCYILCFKKISMLEFIKYYTGKAQ